jgi:hypothetical protein
MLPSPTRMFLNKGVGVHRHALTAFEFALRDAVIAHREHRVCVRPQAAAWRARRPGAACRKMHIPYQRMQSIDKAYWLSAV